jgi:hypothetical protein
MKRLESTRKIDENAVLRVYKKGFGYSRLNVIEVNEYYIAALAQTEFTENIKPGDDIDVYLWVENVASYDFCLKVLGKIEIENKIVFLNHTEKIEWNQERRCLAAKVDIPVRFFLFDTGDRGKTFSTEKVKFHQGKIIELGDRSARIKCSESLWDGAFYKGHIEINGSDLELVGKCSLTDAGDIYQVTFTGMHDRERNRLLDYVFSEYREYENK